MESLQKGDFGCSFFSAALISQILFALAYPRPVGAIPPIPEKVPPVQNSSPVVTVTTKVAPTTLATKVSETPKPKSPGLALHEYAPRIKGLNCETCIVLINGLFKY